MYTLVILGAGFCGSLIAKAFDRRKDVDITLLDKKSYFKYTPSIHKVLFDKNYLQKINVPYSTFLKRTRVVTDSLLMVTPQLVETKNEKMFFDYLVIQLA